MNLDRNQIIGIGLIAVLFIGFTFFSPKEEEIPTTPQKTEQALLGKKTELAEATKIAKDSLDTTSTALLPEKIVEIENEDIKFKISSKGARIYDVELKNYLTYDKKSNVVLFKKALTSQKTMLNGVDISDSTLDYTLSQAEPKVTVKGDNSHVVELTANVGGKAIVQSFIIPSKGFLIDHKIAGAALANAQDLGFDLSNTMAVTERKFTEVDALKFERQHTSLNYLTSEDDFEEIIGMGADDDAPEQNVKWYSLRQRFFTIACQPINPISQAKFTTYHGSEASDTNYLKSMKASYKVALTNDKQYQSKLYFGPNDYYKLEATGIEDLGKNVDMGWLIFGVINKFIILPVFDGLASVFGDFGLVIFFLVLFIKIILFPIAYKSYQSMAKMKALKPDIDKLKAKHGDDKQAFGAAQMSLYKEAGVNPLSGCLPQLLQIPFLFALFRFFPNAIQLRQQSFLWANDLSTYDALIGWDTWIWGVGSHISIFTILMTLTTLVNTWYNSQFSSMSSGGADNPMAEQMKYLMYFMPLIFFFVLNDYPAGLTYYYFLSTLFTIGQQFVANKMINTDDLRLSIEKNIKNHATGNVKKSRFQQRLESAMQAQEAAKKK